MRRVNIIVCNVVFAATILVAHQVEGQYISSVNLSYWQHESVYTLHVMRPQYGGWKIDFVNGFNWDISNLAIPATVIEEWEDWEDLDKDGNPKIKQRVCTVTGIKEDAFENCFNLTSVSIPDTVSYIGEAAFTGCSGLTHITIPDSVTTIEKNAFSGCEGLSSVTIGSGVTVVPRNAFGDCRRLASVNLPTGVSTIDNGAFNGCVGLTAVSIPNTVTTIGEHAFDYCKSLTTVSIPSSVTTLGSSSFAYSGLTSLTIPNSITSLADSTFSFCESLERVTLPDMLVSIGSGCFGECSSLKQVTIPQTVTSIDNRAFIFCSELKEVTFEGDAPMVGNNAFAAVNSKCVVRIPKGNATYNVVDGRWQGMAVVWYGKADETTPSVGGDENAIVEETVSGDFTIKPSDGEKDVVITIPGGVEPEKVTVEVRPDVETVRPNGATIKVVNGGKDITGYISESSLAPDANGVVNLAAAKLDKEAVFVETTEGDNQKSEEAVLTAAMSDDAVAEATVESAKPGLYYSMEASSELGFPADAEKTKSGAPKLATDTTVTIAKPAEKPVGNAVFYRIKVSKTGN